MSTNQHLNDLPGSAHLGSIVQASSNKRQRLSPNLSTDRASDMPFEVTPPTVEGSTAGNALANLGSGAQFVALDKPLHGISISECVCIELCAGSAKYSSALQNLGFAVLPVDCNRNKHRPRVRCLVLDLTAVAAKSILMDIINGGRVVHIHSAAPCGTGTKAREIPISAVLKAQGAPEPKPLRSDKFPLGLPGIWGRDKARVEQANAIYLFCAFAMQVCIDRNILASAENPRNADLWMIDPWPALCAHPAQED